MSTLGPLGICHFWTKPAKAMHCVARPGQCVFSDKDMSKLHRTSLVIHCHFLIRQILSVATCRQHLEKIVCFSRNRTVPYCTLLVISAVCCRGNRSESGWFTKFANCSIFNVVHLTYESYEWCFGAPVAQTSFRFCWHIPVDVLGNRFGATTRDAVTPSSHATESETVPPGHPAGVSRSWKCLAWCCG